MKTAHPSLRDRNRSFTARTVALVAGSLVAIPVGCEGGSSGEGGAAHTGPWASGDRLRAVVIEAEGGATRFDHWFDNQLGIACSFQTMADGSLRCVPPLSDGGRPGYADEACTLPLVRRIDCGDLVTVTQMNDVGCATGVVVYELGSDVEDTAQPHGFDIDGSCFAGDGWRGEPAGVANRLRRFATGAAIPPSRFVKGRLEQRPSSAPGVGIRRIVADDGAELDVDLVNEATGAACDLRASGACFPAGSVNTDLGVGAVGAAVFADDACTQPMYVAFMPLPEATRCGGEPPVAYVPYGTRDSCGRSDEFGVHPITDVLVDTYFIQSEGSCLQAPPMAVQVRLLGPAMSDAEAPPLPARVAAGTGGVVMKTWVDAEGRPAVATGPFSDATTGASCDARRFADGLRCVPSTAPTDATYLAGCMTPRASEMPWASCDRDGSVVLTPVDPGACPLVYVAGEPGAYTRDVASYTGDGVTCRYVPDAHPDVNAASAPLSLVDPARWPALVERTE